MGEIFQDAYRSIQVDETDYNSPDNENTYAQVRINVEVLIKSNFYTGIEGIVAGNPPDDSTGELLSTDSSATIADNDVDDFLLLIVDGLAKGNMYTIDLSVEDSEGYHFFCTGDNLYSDGVRDGDSFMIFHNFLSPGTAHNHDGVNTPTVVLADNSIVHAKYQDDSMALDKMENGTVQSLPSDAQEGTEYSDSSFGEGTYATKLTYYIYLPANATVLYLHARCKYYSATYDACRFTVADSASDTIIGQNSGSNDTALVDWVWGSCYKDVSAYSGLCKITIDLKRMYMQGFSFSWH